MSRPDGQARSDCQGSPGWFVSRCGWGTHHRGRRGEDGGAARHAVHRGADGAEPVQALGVPVVALPARHLRDRMHQIVCLAAELVLRHEADQIGDAVGGRLRVVAEGQLLRRRVLARHPVRHAAGAARHAGRLGRRPAALAPAEASEGWRGQRAAMQRAKDAGRRRKNGRPGEDLPCACVWTARGRAAGHSALGVPRSGSSPWL